MSKTIYDTEAKLEIGEFIDNAIKNTSIFIPDLQRNYVWSPSQIIMLVDSVFRGWPFGSLLTWEVFPEYDENHNLIEGIPYRCFYTKVSRVSNVDSEEANARDLASASKGDLMILDGQQRLQSLLLAFADNKGVCLYDHDWKLDQKDVTSRGIRRNYERYSTASLYLNVGKFMNEMIRHSNVCSQIELGAALEWVIIKKEACSARRSGYPLECLTDSDNFYIRLSDLWDLSDSDNNDIEVYLRPAVIEYLTKYPLEKQDKLFANYTADDKDGTQVVVDNLAKFLFRLSEIKQIPIRCLKIRKFVESKNGETLARQKEVYYDAIVNIFTRLNTAGRSLTREEITFAWLKQGWTKSEKYPKATDFVEELQRIFADWRLSADDIIRALAIIWGVQCNEGTLLRERDLLQSAKIKPMASFLSTHTGIIEDIALRVSEILKKNDCTPADSFNATIIAWAYYLLGEKWRKNNSMNNPRMKADSERKDLDDLFTHFMAHWFVLPSWGQKWAVNIQLYTESLTKKLYQGYSSLVSVKDFSALKSLLQRIGDELLETARQGALDNIRLRLAERKVYLYRSRLIAWQRLTEKRAKYRELTFKTADTKGVPELQVDHIIAFAAWEDFINSKIADGSLTARIALDLFSERDEDEKVRLEPTMTKEDIKNYAMAFINNIGNCSILNISYNSSKDRTELGTFMEGMQEFKKGENGVPKVNQKEWLEEMIIDEIFVHPFSKGFKLEDMVRAIKERENAIYSDLEKFIEHKPGFDVLY